MVQGLRHHASTAESMSLTPGWGTKTSHATWPGGKKKGLKGEMYIKHSHSTWHFVSAQETLATICNDNYSGSSYLVVTIPWTPEIPALRAAKPQALCQTSKQSQGQSPLFLLPQLSLLRFLLPLLPTDHRGKPGGRCSLSAPPSPGSHQGFQDLKVDFPPLCPTGPMATRHACCVRSEGSGSEEKGANLGEAGLISGERIECH